MQPNKTIKKISTISLVIWGILLVLLGLPYIGIAMIAYCFTIAVFPGIVGAVTILIAVYMITGFPGVLLSSFAGIVAGFGIHKKLVPVKLIPLTCGTGVVAAVLGSLTGKGMMELTAAELEFLIPLYSAAGLTEQVAQKTVELLAYLSPGLGAVQIVIGTVISCLFVYGILSKRKGSGYPVVFRFQLGILPAYLLIIMLFLNFVSLKYNMSTVLMRFVHNGLVFMILPYVFAGISILRLVLQVYQTAVFLFIVLMMIFFPPVVIAVLALAGLLDTWFDFHGKMDKQIERLRNESSANH